MQPNQQDPNYPNNEPAPNPAQPAPQPETPAVSYSAQTPPPPQPNVPDFLHLDPIPDPTLVASRKNKTKRKIIFGFVLIVILATAGILAYLWWQQNTPQAKFYRALENHMQLSYIKRDFEVKKDDSSTTIAVSTDMSDPTQTKSDMLTTTSSTTSEASLSMQTVVLNNKQYMFTIKSAVPKSSLDGFEENQWYRAPFHAASRKDVGYWVDDMGSPLALNSVQGLVPTGNFTSDQRSQLLDYAQSYDVYQILGTQTQADNGTQLTGYSIRLDIDKINALNKEMVKLLGLTQVFTMQKPYPPYQEATFWVNEATGRFAKITYNSGESKDEIDTKQVITFTYPDELSIPAPSGVKELSS